MWLTRIICIPHIALSLSPWPARHRERARERERGATCLSVRRCVPRLGSQEAAKREVGNLADLSLPASLVFAYIKPCSTRSSLSSAEPATRRLACERGAARAFADFDVIALKRFAFWDGPRMNCCAVLYLRILDLICLYLCQGGCMYGHPHHRVCIGMGFLPSPFQS